MAKGKSRSSKRQPTRKNEDGLEFEDAVDVVDGEAVDIEPDFNEGQTQDEQSASIASQPAWLQAPAPALG